MSQRQHCTNMSTKEAEGNKNGQFHGSLNCAHACVIGHCPEMRERQKRQEMMGQLAACLPDWLWVLLISSSLSSSAQILPDLLFHSYSLAVEPVPAFQCCTLVPYMFIMQWGCSCLELAPYLVLRWVGWFALFVGLGLLIGPRKPGMFLCVTSVPVGSQVL